MDAQNAPSANKPVRNPSLDVLRITAFFLVVSHHFAYASDFIDLPIGGKKMFVMTVVRTVTVCCVPLFIMLTGYLQTNKKPCAAYYRGIVRPAATYVLACGICLAYKVICYDYSANPLSLILRILDFSASDYGWYMEMYFGLFLMIPFLNAAYHAMKSQKQKLLLVASFLILTALPGILNTLKFTDISWWAMPSADKSYNKLIPGWWTGMYPVTYYFIGSYLREYPLKLKKRTNIILLGLSVMLIGLYNFYRLRGGTFFYGAFLTNASLFVAVVSVLIFVFIAERNMRSLPPFAVRSLKLVSGWTLAAYLVSQIFDVQLYRILKNAVPVIENRVYYAPVMVISVFVCSLAVGGVTDGIYRMLSAAVSAVQKKLAKQAKEP